MIARNVDVGQTVAASLQAPALFVIANDLTQMQVNASIDEADIGRVQPGQDVTFRVDAYPDADLRRARRAGAPAAARLQNVVTYNTHHHVDNAEPAADAGHDGHGLGRSSRSAKNVAPHARGRAALPARGLRGRAPARAGGGRRGGRAAGRRSRGRGGAGAGGAGGPGGGGGAGAGAGGPAAAGGGGQATGAAGAAGEGGAASSSCSATKGSPKPSPVRIGISDGQFVEVKDGLDGGRAVVTGIDERHARGRAPASAGRPRSEPLRARAARSAAQR